MGLSSVWEDGEEEEAEEIILGFKKIKKQNKTKNSTIYRSIFTPSVIKLPRRKTGGGRNRPVGTRPSPKGSEESWRPEASSSHGRYEGEGVGLKKKERKRAQCLEIDTVPTPGPPAAPTQASPTITSSSRRCTIKKKKKQGPK